MSAFLGHVRRWLVPGSGEHKFSAGATPSSIKHWLALIDTAHDASQLSRHAEALMKQHEISIRGHAENAFADGITTRARARLKDWSANPMAKLENVIEEPVKWNTALQCGHSHDASKGYFYDAEPFMDMQWNTIIQPLIHNLDFTTTLDLACGHGRNTEYLRRRAKQVRLVDIDQSCIDACRERFGDENGGVRFFYHVTDGNHLKMVASNCITLVYPWDSMVHFDKLIVRDYLSDVARILAPCCAAFLHHSNYGATSPDSNLASNPGPRSDMSADIMREYAVVVGLQVVSQHIQGRAEGWWQDDFDFASILRKP